MRRWVIVVIMVFGSCEKRNFSRFAVPGTFPGEWKMVRFISTVVVVRQFGG